MTHHPVHPTVADPESASCGSPEQRSTIRFLILLLGLVGPIALAQPSGAGPLGDYGDAPFGALAYPSNGVIGQFPTCFGSPVGFVGHLTGHTEVRFGHVVDFEPDGNGGLCAWPPYDNDECFGPPDAGLIRPDSYTISGGVEMTCSPSATGMPLGPPCSVASWGPNVDIDVTNLWPSTMYLNVLIDWNQDGVWAGGSPCTSGAAVEHVLQNFPVPPGFSGPLSLLAPPPFLIGPNAGFVWARFTIGEVPVPVGWNGAHTFDLGETEDYLLRVGTTGGGVGGILGDYGDAPDGAIAYPSTAVIGQFPTCVGGATGYVVHGSATNVVHFGGLVDYENDGNGGTCAWPPYNNDECFGPPDAGLIIPDGYTINAAMVEEPCSGTGRPLGPPCTTATWGAAGNVDIDVTNLSNAVKFVNVLIDWNGDGVWSGAAACPAAPAPEHVLVDFPVPPGYSGALSGLAPPSFQIGPNAGFAWARFTIGEVSVGAGWTGAHFFDLGETEDYLLRIGNVVNAVAQIPEVETGLRLEPARPNPFRSSSAIAFTLDREASVRVTVTDASGRVVTHLLDGMQPAGRHQVSWNGRSDGGQAMRAGVYFVRVQSGSRVRSEKLALTR